MSGPPSRNESRAVLSIKFNEDTLKSKSSSSEEHLKYEAKAAGPDANMYDFVAARPQIKTTSVLESIGDMMKSCLGGGIVAIHEAYQHSGIWTGLGLTFVIAIVNTYCIHITVHSAQRIYGRVQVPSMTFPELAEASLEAGPWPRLKRFGNNFRYIVDTLICLELFSACCIYVVIIARSIKQLIDDTDLEDDEVPPPLRIYILVLMIPCALIATFTGVKYLAPIYLIAQIFTFILTYATAYYGISSDKELHSNPFEMPPFKSIAGAFEVMGLCCFTMDGIGVAMSIENNMTNPRSFPKVLIGGMSAIFLMIITVGFFGCWGFGNGVMSPITINFPWLTYPTILKMFLIVMIYMTFGMNFWIPFNVIWSYTNDRIDLRRRWLWEPVFRILMVAIIGVVALTLPNISKFFGLIGCLCLSSIGIIFPTFIELSVSWVDPGLGRLYWRLWKSALIILFGLNLAVFGTYFNFKELILEIYF